MILIEHKNEQVLSVKNTETGLLINTKGKTCTAVFIEVCRQFPNDFVIWAHSDACSSLNLSQFKQVFTDKKKVFSFGPIPYLPDAIGYVESSPFVEVNTEICYPTWRLNAFVGGMHASTFLSLLNDESAQGNNFQMFLQQLGKSAQQAGIFCYSNPALVGEVLKFNLDQAPMNLLYEFVVKNYKRRWTLFLFLSLLIFEKKLTVLSFLKSFFVGSDQQLFHKNSAPQSKAVSQDCTDVTIDVVIPTLGRKKYLLDVLDCLQRQTLIPKQVIIVEQVEEGQESDFPKEAFTGFDFQIIHKVIHTFGACQARNVALPYIKSEYVFLADDDILFEPNLLVDVLCEMQINAIDVATISCKRIGDTFKSEQRVQWHAFGSGCSILKSECLKNITFDTGFEFGFGEDLDFGMQLRNAGHDVIYLPTPVITHLKAPIGGFRKKNIMPWENQVILPKPAPTIMLYWIKYMSKEQINGLRLVMFMKFYKQNKIKNPISYIKEMNQRWNSSVDWANKLKNT